MSTRIPEGLVSFFESATGKAYVRTVDEYMDSLRFDSKQPNPNLTHQKYTTTRDAFVRTLDDAGAIFRSDFRDRISGTNTLTMSALEQMQEVTLVMDTFDYQGHELRTLMTQRYEKPFSHGRYPSTNPFVVTPESRNLFRGWGALKPGSVGVNKVDGVPNTLLNLTSVANDVGAQSKTVYVVDGNNCFYSYSPVDWADELRIDRHGEYGPVVIYLKGHVFRDKLQKWYEGPTYVYNALQELHGGVRLGHPVYIVAIDVRQCKSTEDVHCLEYGAKNNKCQIRDKRGKAVVFPPPLCPEETAWDHFLCEFDDVAANILYNQMTTEMQKANAWTGFHRDVTFVTNERPKNYMKTQFQIDAISKAMETISDAVTTRIWILHPQK